MTATASTAPGAGGHTSSAIARDPYVRAVAVITVLAAVVRFAVVGIPSFWPDEGFTIHVVDGSLAHALDTIPETESTPPLYYVLAWGWAKLFGTSEAGIRSLSALCGVLTVPIAAAAASRLVDRRTGIVTAVLVAANPFLIWFAQEARAYALMVLLAAIGFAFFVRFLDLRDRSSLLCWTVASGLLLCTHYYGVLIVAAEAGWMLAAARADRRRIAAGLAAVAAVGIALLPLVARQRDNEFATPLAENASTFLRTLQVPKQFAVGFDAPAEALVSVICLVLALAGLALVVARRTPAERDRLQPAAFVGIVVVAVPVLLGAAGYGFVSARYEVAAMIPLTICVAAGFAAPAVRRLGIGLAVALTAIWLGIVAAVAADPLLQTRGDWRNAAEVLGPVPPGGRAIVVSPASGRSALELYLPDAAPISTPVVSVAEIDLLSVRSSQDEKLGAMAVGPGTPRQDLPAVFKEAGRTRTDSYMIVRYRAAGPAPVAVNVFGGLRLDDTGWVGLLER